MKVADDTFQRISECEWVNLECQHGLKTELNSSNRVAIESVRRDIAETNRNDNFQSNISQRIVSSLKHL